MRARPTLVSIAALVLGLAGASHAAETPRASEPKNASRVEPQPDEAKPEQQTHAAQPAGRQKILDDLFDRLAKTKDTAEAQGIAGAIQRVWSRSGSDTADIIMERTTALIRKKDWATADDMLSKLVDIEPDWAEAWSTRATVRFFQQDTSGAMEDLAHVLKLEPRHFTALVGVGAILERNEQKAQALRVFRRVLEINPQLDEIRTKVEKLSIDVEGREI